MSEAGREIQTELDTIDEGEGGGRRRTLGEKPAGGKS